MKILYLDRDLDEYARILDKIKNKSSYFLPSYLQSVQCAENYPVIIANINYMDKVALIPYVRRKINDLPIFRSLDHELWDFVTPHEYSAVLTSSNEPEERNILIDKLCQDIGAYCKKERVVAEFVRFDPFLNNIQDMHKHYSIRCAGQNIYIDLFKTIDEIWGSFSRAARKNIRTAMGFGLQFIESYAEKVDIGLFLSLYKESMRRLDARTFYFFNETYFSSLLEKCEGTKMFFVRDAHGTPIAASIIIFNGDIAHHHLTGYDDAALSKRPNDFMIYQLILWAKARGLKYLHLGGGGETIRNFKSKFSPLSIPYYVGSRIHNKEWYDKLCLIWKSNHSSMDDSSYFPLYRGM